METFSAADRYVLEVVRYTVEACRLPHNVMLEFREWIIYDLFRRGADAISDHLIETTSALGVTDDDGDEQVFSTYLGVRFYDFLEGAGSVHAPLFKPRKPAPVVVVEEPKAHVAHYCGPALPPAIADALRERGVILTKFEDGEAWNEEAQAQARRRRELELLVQEARTASVEDPPPLTDPVERLQTAAVAAIAYLGDAVGNPFRQRRRRGRMKDVRAFGGGTSGDADFDVAKKMFMSSILDTSIIDDPGPEIVANDGATIDHTLEAMIDYGIHNSDGGSLMCGLTALVTDDGIQDAMVGLGKDCAVSEFVEWAEDNEGLLYHGPLTLRAVYDDDYGDVKALRYYVHRDPDGSMVVDRLLRFWRDDRAALDPGLPG